jgi:hypothetical protein
LPGLSGQRLGKIAAPCSRRPEAAGVAARPLECREVVSDDDDARDRARADATARSAFYDGRIERAADDDVDGD